MKKSVLFLAIMIAAVVSGCSKGSSMNKPVVNNGGIYKGVILKGICCQIVVQTIGPDYLGQMNWRDSYDSSGIVYNHVFKVADPCQFGANAGDTIKFRFVPTQVQNCACCMLATPVPDSSYSIEVVK
jgi:hypothetical protein